MNSRLTCDQINTLVNYLIRVGLADDQQFAFEREGSTNEVTFQNSGFRTYALKDLSYEAIYVLFSENRVFNVKLLDGALLQMEYLFSNNDLLKHRLAFMPSPFLEQYERDPSAYEEEHVFTEIVGRKVIPLPLRFDYDCDDEKHEEIYHPKSHLTLGEYRECRIPVTSPITPQKFLEFILRHFYRTSDNDFSTEMPQFTDRFDSSITSAELEQIHVVVA